MPSIASASAGSSGIGSRTSSKHDGVRVRPVEDRGPRAVARPWRRSATWRRSGSRGRGRRPGDSSGSARVGTRSVSASQIGKSWMTGALPSSGAPMAAICAGEDPVGARRGVARCRRSRAAARPRTAREAKIASSGPSHATGRVQPSRRPSRGDARRRARRGADTISSTCDRRRRRGGTCPRSSRPGTARLVARKVSSATSSTGRRARSRPCHGSASSPMSDIGMPRSSRTLNRLWPRPVTRISSRPAGSGREVAGEGRRVVPGEDVEPAHRQRVGRPPGRGAGCRTRPSRGRPTARTRAGSRRRRRRSGAAGRPRVSSLRAPGQPGPGRARARRPRCG